MNQSQQLLILRHVSADTRKMMALVQTGLTPAQVWRSARVAPASAQQLMPVWQVVCEFGVAPVDCLRRFAESCEHGTRMLADATAHASGSRLAMRVIMLLPLISLCASLLGGYNPFPFLVGTILGWVLCLVALCLLGTAHRWMLRIMADAHKLSWATGLPAELMGLALTAGATPQRARECAQHIPEAGFRDARVYEQELQVASNVMMFAHRAGAPAAELLRAEAENCRRRQQSALIAQRQKMTVRILYPLGACVLPAFIAVGVIPVIATVLSSTQF